MKSKFLLTIKIAALVLAVLATSSCSDLFTNPMKDKKTGQDLKLLLIDLNFFDTKFNFTFVDAETGNLINDKTIGVFFAGDDANNLVDYNGNKSASYTITDGRLALALDPNITVSQDNSVDFTIYVDVQDDSYDGYPVEVSYNTKGEYDIVVQLFKTGFGVKRADVSPTTEPFSVKYNGSLVLKSGDPVWNYTEHLSSDNGKTYYGIYKTYGTTSSGILSVDNFTEDSALYANWGIEGGYFASGAAGTFELTHKNKEVPANASLFKAYSATQRNDVDKCADGLNIKVSEKNSSAGTAKFSYKLVVDGEIVKSGKVGGSSMPFTVSTGVFYYPHDASPAKLYVDDDPQFTIEPHETTLSDFCGGTVNLTATPKTGLQPFKIITTFVCPDNVIGITPSISGRYKIKGSDDPWAEFAFTEGIATLNLVPGETYTMDAKMGEDTYTFDFPTDESKVSSVVGQALVDIAELEDLNVDFSTNSDGVTVIDVEVLFKDGNCPM